MSDEPTCGKGLAANSILPARMAAVTAAMADVLEGHRKSLDLDDAAGREEDAAYATLTAGYRDLTNAMAAISERMAGYRDLPMPAHDEQALMTPAAVAAFERYVHTKRDLLNWLQDAVRQDEEMLSAMQGA